MRETHKIQPTLTEPWLDLPHAKELKAISDLLHQHSTAGEIVAQDIGKRKPKRRAGLTGAQALRALIVKQMNGFSYEELAFHLADSQTYRVFYQPGLTDRVPRRSTLAENIKRIQAPTLERINRILLDAAKTAGIEKGRKVRVDSTESETNSHPPRDSWLLYDSVRVLTRLMNAAKELGVEGVVFSNRIRRAKRRWIGIQRARNKRQRRKLYRNLVNATAEVVATAAGVLKAVEEHQLTSSQDTVRPQALA